MSTTEIGRRAETAVADYLKQRNYKILEQNWRTRWCEIDIVAKKSNTIYFVEVKYRKTNGQGDGVDYITSKKLKQMAFAAELWVNSHTYDGRYVLAAASVAGKDFEVANFIEIV